MFEVGQHGDVHVWNHALVDRNAKQGGGEAKPVNDFETPTVSIY